MKPGQVVAITGAGSGIGRATARAFAAQGCNLVLSGRRAAPLDSIRDEVGREFGVDAVTVLCDVRNPGDVQRIVDTAVARFGRLSVLVNNAGAGLYARVEDTSEQEFRGLIETNLLGVFHGIKAAVPVMRRQGEGHIAIVGSAVGKRSWPFHGAYAATKFALSGLTQGLRAELAGSGVSVSLILPVSTRTSFFRTARVTVPGYVPKPIGVVQPPEAVARVIVRSADRPSPEMDVFWPMRIAYVLAEAFPRLADFAARRYYSRVARSLVSPPQCSSKERAAPATTGTE